MRNTYESWLKMNKDLKRRKIVLAEGYPWAIGVEKYRAIKMNKEPRGLNSVPLEFPNFLWKVNVKKYRLVLEPIDE